ncbi:hypothetical protein CDL12_00740 [Handroanthus impetiginosus]|uniref:Ubiquitinyl hydrolase 1 n=1 Tax=Handroanthus impetiginosus TaxID=429701 RepID=A0A2G9I9S6_9LAMI|nr:hypothetical protein CDL12_00740 [Handroanthus impetiginosus]
MGHCCILIPRPRDEEVCRGRRKLKEITRRLHCWVDAQKLIEFPWLYWWGECKLPNKVHDAEDSLKSITAEMVFESNPTSQELCLLNSDNAVAVIVRAKDQKIKELKKKVAKLEAATNKDLCVLIPVKADAAATKEQRDRGTAYEEEEDEEDEEMDEERKDDKDEEEEEKVEEDEQKEEKTKEGQDDKKGKKEDGEDDEGKEKAGQVSCHHEIEMNRKLEAISWKLNFGQDVNFGEWDYEAVCTLSSIVDSSNLKLNVKAFKKYN